MVTFRQQSRRLSGTIIFTTIAIAFIVMAMVTARGGHMSASQKSGTYLLGSVLAFFYILLAVRSWRSCVILVGDTLKVRSVTRTRRIRLDDSDAFDLYFARILPGYVVGIRRANGRVVRFPLWAPSRTLESSRNDRMREVVQQMIEIASQLHNGCELTPGIVEC